MRGRDDCLRRNRKQSRGNQVTWSRAATLLRLASEGLSNKVTFGQMPE